MFKFIKDDDFEKNYEKHLLTYDNKEVYIKTNNIENFDVEENGYNQKYIRLQYDNIDANFIEFINKFEDNGSGKALPDNIRNIIIIII